MAVFRTIFSHANSCTWEVGLVWCKFKLKSKIPHLWKWHQQWDITFFDNVELCELGIPSLIVHEDDNLLSTLRLLRVCKEKSWAWRMNLIPKTTVWVWVHISAKCINCFPRSHGSCATKIQNAYSWRCRICCMKCKSFLTCTNRIGMKWKDTIFLRWFLCLVRAFILRWSLFLTRVSIFSIRWYLCLVRVSICEQWCAFFIRLKSWLKWSFMKSWWKGSLTKSSTKSIQVTFQNRNTYFWSKDANLSYMHRIVLYSFLLVLCQSISDVLLV